MEEVTAQQQEVHVVVDGDLEDLLEGVERVVLKDRIILREELAPNRAAQQLDVVGADQSEFKLCKAGGTNSSGAHLFVSQVVVGGDQDPEGIRAWSVGGREFQRIGQTRGKDVMTTGEGTCVRWWLEATHRPSPESRFSRRMPGNSVPLAEPFTKDPEDPASTSGSPISSRATSSSPARRRFLTLLLLLDIPERFFLADIKCKSKIEKSSLF